MSVASIDIESLSVDERLQLLDRLWDSLERTPTEMPVTDAQRDELVRRRAELAADPGRSLSMDEIERQILSPRHKT